MSTSEREQILQGLAPLFERAKNEGLWFHCHYQDMWFSPAELRACHSEGRFVWGACNWTLRDPQELVKSAEESVVSAKRRLDQTVARVQSGGGK